MQLEQLKDGIQNVVMECDKVLKEEGLDDEKRKRTENLRDVLTLAYLR